MTIEVSVSILSANFASLKDEVLKINRSHADMIHIDVMDGNFVPNITIGHEVVKSIKTYSKIPFDVHLMVHNPDKQIKNFAESGADIITIHPETTQHLDATLSYIKSFGIKAGVALLPTSSIEILNYIADKIDLVLVMTVNPGFGGQKFLNSQLSKINAISKKIDKNNIKLSVDGGIDPSIAPSLIQSGIDILVSGSYIYRSINMEVAISELKNCNLDL